MESSKPIALHFGPYRLAGPQGPLFRDDQPLKLKPKTLGVLWFLARQAGEVVTKTALLDALWPQSVVGEDALIFQIQALRRALDDDAKQPRYIATLHRVGYSFIAPVTSGVRVAEAPAAPRWAAPGGPPFVGREVELARLRERWGAASRGERQLALVTGEAGIGKTSLVESFLDHVSGAPRIARGQCVEQHGAGEAYLPVLEALGRLCRQAQGEEVLDVLGRVAPTWLLQLPALLSAEDVAGLQKRTAGATRERMLREVADALDALTATTPLVLVLEDLHWSDPSTIDLLSLLARRREPARLMVLATCRPQELAIANHPLQTMTRELVARGQMLELALGNLRAADVRTYLARRFPANPDDAVLSTFVYRRSEGHPLFMVQIADYLAAEDVLGGIPAPEAVVPQQLQQLIEVQLGRLPELDQRVLQAASLAGAEFAVASVAAGAQLAHDAVEDACERLVRQGQFIEDRGLATWPDGTVSGRYAFRHALYRDVLSQRLGSRQRARMHLDIGAREAAAFGERCTEIAAELALHFELGQDFSRAVDHRQQAGDKALQGSANAEAVEHFERGLELLASLPASPARDQRELRLRVALGLAIAMIRGYSAPEVAQTNARARQLSQHLEDSTEVSLAVFRLHQFYHARAELDPAREMAQRLLRIAEHAQSPALLSRAHTTLSFERVSRGDFIAARDHSEASLGWYARQQRKDLGAGFGDDPAAVALVVSAWALQVLGLPDQAQARNQECLTAARELALPYASAALLTSVADFRLLRRESLAVREAADAAIAICGREGFPYFLARATILRGWALAAEGELDAGIAQLRDGLASFQPMGARLWLPRYLALLADAHGKAGRTDEGLAVAAEALALIEETDEREYEAELHRLRAELTLPRRGRGRLLDEAEAHAEKAIAVARAQSAKLFELRATVTLCRIAQRRGDAHGAHERLAKLVDGFGEGAETVDVREARGVLAEPSGGAGLNRRS
jgi:DNA-binding winged helix-turn-helix (wHTH) protein/predicted ATPase